MVLHRVFVPEGMALWHVWKYGKALLSMILFGSCAEAQRDIRII